jgi:hypothetical protein
MAHIGVSVFFLEYNRVEQMTNAGESIKQLEIISATREARELFRIRNSFTFNLGIELVRSVKNPLLLPILPFRIIRLFFAKRTMPNSNFSSDRTGFLIIGIDRTGDYHSSQAELIAGLISDSNLGDVTLVNNSVTPSSNLSAVEWYRIPPVRERNKSRKEWNIMAERVLSTATSISSPLQIIYFGDYLYRGVVDALSPLTDTRVGMSWFHSKIGTLKKLDNKKFPKMVPIQFPKFSISSPTSKSIHRILRRSELEDLILVDVSPKNESLLMPLIENKEGKLLVAVQREHALPSGIDFVVRMDEIIGCQLEGNIRVVVDDYSPLLSSLPTIQASTLLFRTGNTLSPIIDMMIRQLELKGTLVVVRRKNSEDLRQGLHYFSELQTYSKANRGVMFSPGFSSLTDYVLYWLKQLDQSYN